MTIKNAEFSISYARVEQCPQSNLPEFAFIGRSNVGKSSLINMLTGKAGLAKTSATPGKTVLINYFLIKGQGARGNGQENTNKPQSNPPAPCPLPLAPKSNPPAPCTLPLAPKNNPPAPCPLPLAPKDAFYFVDLPGYGFAKRGQRQRDELQRMISGYILRREQMMNLFLLIDARHEPQRIDMEFIQWLGENSIPFSIVFTKADKLSKGRLAANIKHYLDELSKQWEELPPYFITSSETRQGRDEVLGYIDEMLKSFL